MIHSSDFGATWACQQTGVSQLLHSVKFINPLNGWACGEDGTVINTNDGGLSWNKMTVPTTQACNYLSVLTTGCVVIVCDSGIIIKTSDYGSNWIKSVPVPHSDLFSVYFADNMHGWVIGYTSHPDPTTFILKTTNGGATWKASMFDYHSFLKSIYFIDEHKGWAVGTNHLIMSTINGGETWKMQYCPHDEELYAVYFINDRYGLVSCSCGDLLITHDGGKTFKVKTSGTNGALFSLYINSAGDAWGFGSYGCILNFPQMFRSTTIAPRPNRHGDELCISPNPVTESTTIAYSLAKPGNVTIRIFSLNGIEVTNLLDEYQEKGHHQVRFNKSNLSPGIYVCELRSPTQILVDKMLVTP
jgi:photosystem II stability/assembly factor-like uncharacterized protein